MRGMLMDVNVQGYLPYLRRLLDQLELAPFLLELDLALVTFSDLDLSLDLDDRTLWNHCQSDG